MLSRTEFEEPPERRVRIVHAPVSYHAGPSARGAGFVRLQTELESADVEPT
jgi:hypothetical protein